MNYSKIYKNIIQNRIQNPVIDDYTECHHIIPKSLGGSDNQSNLVNLLAREHFICHLLLTKIYQEGTTEWIKMIKAFMRMYSKNCFQHRYSNNKWYEYLRINFSKAQSLNQKGQNNSQYGNCWVSNLKTKECKSIKQNELQQYLNEGWIKKRIINWDGYVDVNGVLTYKPNKRMKQYTEWKLHKSYLKEYYTKLYKIYIEYGINGVYKYSDYKHSRPSLIQQMKRYVDEYNPNNCKNEK